ncbi:unnamed protein product [Pleuronectes platessa]|uniref:Uncharacterized protein n=1 Tax=Pleuronectes platessa TaxID=8262 RepID=A0A9N7Z5W9_PLEPL|nr:unnamed protein product [Pleuronectes platessa]
MNQPSRWERSVKEMSTFIHPIVVSSRRTIRLSPDLTPDTRRAPFFPSPLSCHLVDSPPCPGTACSSSSICGAFDPDRRMNIPPVFLFLGDHQLISEHLNMTVARAGESTSVERDSSVIDLWACVLTNAMPPERRLCLRVGRVTA